MPSSSKRLKFPKKYNQYRIAFNNQKLFIVNGPKKNKEDGIYIQVVSLESGKTVQEFLAVSLDRVEELTADLTSLCTGLVVEGDTLLLTTSPYYYYPSYSRLSCDQVFLISLSREEIITTWLVPHSAHLKKALQYKEMVSHHEDDALEYIEDDDENIGRVQTLMTVVPGGVYVLHSEVIMPDMGSMRELQDWGHKVKVWRVDGKQHQLVFCKANVRIITFASNLLIYEELTNLDQGLTVRERFGTTLINFKDVGKTVHWVNLETGSDCHTQTFSSGEVPLHTCTVMEDGTSQVLQLFFDPTSDQAGAQQYEEKFVMFDLDMKETQQSSRVVQFPKLLHGNEVGDNFELEMLSDGRVYFGHQVFGWSSGFLDYVLPFAMRLVVLEEGEDKPTIEIWNCDDTRSRISGCYPYVFSDMIMRWVWVQ